MHVKRFSLKCYVFNLWRKQTLDYCTHLRCSKHDTILNGLTYIKGTTIKIYVEYNVVKT